jgi:16S rRNA processing protein RimM
LAEDEFYPFDLDGLEVRDPRGAVVGRVVDMVESPAHAILVISLGSGGEAMVPFVLEAVPTVAVMEGFLVVEPRFLGEAVIPDGVGTADGAGADSAGPDGSLSG